jgi:hypothetical protein
MKSLAVALLLASTQAVQTSSSIKNLVASLSRSQQSGGHSCSYAIERMKKPTVDHTQIVGKGVKWTDPDFSHIDNAMYWSDANLYSLNAAPVNWARARDRIPNASIFGTEINPNDVDQGALGDCYFLASCSATAEFNSRFSRAFVTTTYPQEGIIVMRARILGVERTIAIDDYLPFYTWDTSSLFFAK